MEEIIFIVEDCEEGGLTARALGNEITMVEKVALKRYSTRE